MGSVCTTREDSPREAARRYETCTALWQEVISKLSDDAGLSAECSRVYREECRKLGIEQLTKQQWQEMTVAFIGRISCKDQRTKERIYSAVDSHYPGPGERPISEATFAEITRLALTLAERDLRERISEMQAKLGGQPPVSSGNHFVHPPGAPQPAAAAAGGWSAQASSSAAPPAAPAPLLPPTAAPPAGQAKQQSGSASLPQSAQAQPVQFTPSAQRLQDMQRMRADQEQRMLQQQRLQQQLQQLQQQHMQQQGQEPSFQQEQQFLHQQQLLLQQLQQLQMQTQQQSPPKPMQEPSPATMGNSMGLSRQSSRTAEMEQQILQQQELLMQQQQQQMMLQQQQLQQQPPLQQQPQPPQPRGYDREPSSPPRLGGGGPSGTVGSQQSPRPGERNLPTSFSPGAGSSNASVRKPTEEDQMSSGVADTLDGSLSNLKSLGSMKPPALGGTAGVPQAPQTSAPTNRLQSALAPELVEEMKSRILCGHLRVAVFNDHLMLEPKRLALNPKTRRISILRDDGLCEDSWEVDSLRCMTEGIASTILVDPPPAELAMAFRFKFDGAEADEGAMQDRFLCTVLDTAEVTQLALEAFSQLCGVPITRAS